MNFQLRKFLNDNTLWICFILTSLVSTAFFYVLDSSKKPRILEQRDVMELILNESEYITELEQRITDLENQ